MIQLDGIGKEIIDKESNGTLGPPIKWGLSSKVCKLI